MQLSLPKKTLHFCAILLCILSAIYTAIWLWPELYPETTVQIHTPPIDTKTAYRKKVSKRPPLNTDIRDILSANLFNQQSKKIAPKYITTQPIPKTKLSLFLYGIISSSLAEDSIALISHNKKEPALPYKQGDTLPNQGGTVYLILESQVQIKRNGRLEKLELIKEKNTQPLKKAAFKYSARSKNMSLTEIKSSYKANAPQLLNKMGLQKTAQGIKLSTKKGKLPSGLQANDIITSVNGYTLADLESDPNLLDTLLQENKIEAALLRNGRTIHITIPQNLIRQWK